MEKPTNRLSGELCLINPINGTPADNRPNEEWIPIKGFEHRVWISNEGRVLSLGRTMIAKDGHQRIYPDKLLKLTPKPNGYTRARLYHDGGKTYEDHLVHRLVATHFIPNPDDLPVVNHVDEVRNNNNAENLQWVTVQQNVTYNDCHLRAADNRKKPVEQLTLDGDLIMVWSSVEEAHAEGYRKGSIRKVIYRKNKKHKNCIWRYKKVG